MDACKALHGTLACRPARTSIVCDAVLEPGALELCDTFYDTYAPELNESHRSSDLGRDLNN